MSDLLNLGSLIGEDVDSDDYVPGQGRDLGQSPAHHEDWLSIAERLAEAAHTESSALAKSRALTVSAMLLASSGQVKEAVSSLREAATSSPKMSFCTQLYAKQVSESGSAIREEHSSQVIRCWEGAARHSTRMAIRRFSHRMILAEQERLGQKEQTDELLDRVVRAGDGDVAFELERIARRWSEKKSLSKMAYPETLGAEIEAVSELILERPGAESEPRLDSLGDVAGDILLLRASRQLKSNDVAASIASLERCGLPAELVTEFAAALYGAAPGGLPDRIRLLWKLARSKNEKLIWRSLLIAALLASDKASILSILEQVDPSGGTLQSSERIFLLAAAGQDWQSSREELRSLSLVDPIAALALSAPIAAVLQAEVASEDALLIQLGAALSARVTPELKNFTEFSLAEELLAQALAELQKRGTHPLLCSAFAIDDARCANDQPSFVEAFKALSSGAGSTETNILLAAIYESQGSQRQAVELYRGILGANVPSYHLAATRGWFAQLRKSSELRDEYLADALLPDDRSLQNLAADGISRRVTRIELALLDSDLKSRSQKLGELLLSAFHDVSVSDAGGPIAAIFASYAFCAQMGEQVLASALYEKLLSSDAALTNIFRLRNIWETPELAQPKEVMVLARARDPGLRALAGHIGGEQDTLEVGEATRLELVRSFARHVLAGELKSATLVLSGANLSNENESSQSVPEPLLKHVLVDLSELEVSLLGEQANLIAASHFGEQAQNAHSESHRRFALERLAELDERKNDKSSALFWRMALSEEFPNDIASQFRLEELNRSLGLSTQATDQKLSELLPPGDNNSYRAVLGMSALVHGDIRGARKAFEPLLDHAPSDLLAIRALIIVAREKRDDALLRRCYTLLQQRTAALQQRTAALQQRTAALQQRTAALQQRTAALQQRTAALKHQSAGVLDQLCVHHELALIDARNNNHAAAIEQLEQAIQLNERAFSLRYLQNHLSQPSSPDQRARQWHAFARASSHPTHQVSLLESAAQGYLESNELQLSEDCQLEILEIVPENKAAYLALVQLFQHTNNADALRQTYERRLRLVARKSSEQLELELELARHLLLREQDSDAKLHLETLLTDHPACQDALRLHAKVSLRMKAFSDAERSLVALRAVLPQGAEHLQILVELGEIYFNTEGQLEKAMDAYEAIFATTPNDETAAKRLIAIYCTLGLAERAAKLQTQLIQDTTLAESKRTLALGLAEIYESVGKDLQRAAATLERTRKAWPLDAQVLTASIQFLDRHGDSNARRITLSRVEKDARRRLQSGTIDHTLLDTLAAVAQLSGKAGEALACRSAHGVYLGLPDAELRPAGLHCLSSLIDEELAPQGYPAPFRRLLQKTGDAMDAAFSVDLNAVSARPLYEGALHDRVQRIAEAIGWPKIELFISDTLGARCLPVSRNPPRLLLGAVLDRLSGRARDFLLLRAFKLQMMGVGAWSRSRKEDRFAGIVALLQLFSPHWIPPEVDRRKLAQARALIEQGLARVGYEDDVPTLALEAIGALGGQNAGLTDSPGILAVRACLVGVGDLGAVFEAMAAREGKTLAASGPSRFRWIDSNPEARELLLFMTTPHFSRARSVLGLLPEKTDRSAPKDGSNPHAADQTDSSADASIAATASLRPRLPRPPPPRR